MSIKYRKILVTLDGSPFASQVVPYAESFARSVGADLLLLRVVPERTPMGSTVALAEAVRYTTQPLRADEGMANQEQMHDIQNAEKSLQPVVDRLTRNGVHARSVVGVGKPAQQIVDMAEEEDVDVIVMCTHGRAGLTHLVYGSVAEDVLHHAPCPVLLIRPEVDDLN